MDDVSLLENAFLALKIFKDGLKMVGLSKYVKTGGVPSNPIGGVFQNKNVPGQNDHSQQHKWTLDNATLKIFRFQKVVR